MADFNTDFARSDRHARGDHPHPPGPPKPSPAPVAKRYKLESKPFPARQAAPGDGPHRGTGTFTFRKALVDPGTVGRDRTAPLSTQLKFPHPECSIRVMSFEIATAEAPNWFGVSFRTGIQAFDSAVIVCHPFPKGAHMEDADYGTRGGRWSALFRYAEMFGTQLSAATSNLVAVVPFFNNASYGNTGLFGMNWQAIVTDILSAARQDRGLGGAATLKNVVLAGFSRGRQLAGTVRTNCRGLGGFLREVWDFDGVGGATPAPAKGLRVLHYDQHDAVSDLSNFHVPPKLWRGFHGPAADLPTANVHSNIPDMLGWHAALFSGVGRP